MPLDNSPWFQMVELGTTTSTNTYLRDYRPPCPAEMTLVTAEYQTAGRGQTGNSWESEAGRNLLFSIGVRPHDVEAGQVFVMSEAIALSIREAVEAEYVRHGATGDGAALLPVCVKWPNDIYVGESKIAGILIENTIAGSHLGQCIIGCGVNVNQRGFRFPDAAPAGSDVPRPTSLAVLTGRDTERQLLLDDIVVRFRRYYEAISQGRRADIHADYMSALYRRSGLHRYADADGLFLAETEGVEPDGHLVLRDSDGRRRRYAFKEVRFVV